MKETSPVFTVKVKKCSVNHLLSWRFFSKLNIQACWDVSTGNMIMFEHHIILLTVINHLYYMIVFHSYVQYRTKQYTEWIPAELIVTDGFSFDSTIYTLHFSLP